jgi:hypothetical protein
MALTDAARLRERLRPYVERAAAFEGWVFDYAPRVLDGPPPWDYAARARELLAGVTSVLDLGTGGGERFGELLQGYRGRAVATEEWSVNAPLAATRLKPTGAALVRSQSAVLPFRDASSTWSWTVTKSSTRLRPRASWPPARPSSPSRSTPTTGPSCAITSPA